LQVADGAGWVEVEEVEFRVTVEVAENEPERSNCEVVGAVVEEVTLLVVSSVL
jgi:hypothetical protein